jgi:hypothetical protein
VIDLKVTVQEGTRFSKDSGVRIVRNDTPASLLASTGESGKRPLSFRKTSLLIKKIS